MFRLDGKVALVTGASRGLGKAIAIGLAEAGADIVGIGPSSMSATKTEIEKKGKRGRNGIYILVTVVLTLAAVIVGIGMFFKVSEIEVAGGNEYTAEEIIEVSGIHKGDSLLSLKDEDVQ